MAIIKYRSDINAHCLRDNCKKRGWKWDNTDWNIFWALSGKCRSFFHREHGCRLKRDQFINHFPNSYVLSRKDFMPGVLKRYGRELERRGECPPEVIPSTYVLPREYTLFLDEYRDEPNATWILKPSCKSQGSGIVLTTKLDRIKKLGKIGKGYVCGGVADNSSYVVCRYIDRPLLIGGKKFDMRMYVLVTSFKPLKAYLFKSGFCRFAVKNYYLADESLKNQYMHITNHSVQRRSRKYNKHHGEKWSTENLQLYLEGTIGFVSTYTLFKEINGVIVHSLKAAQMVMSSNQHCFECYGYDIIIDCNLKPWLIEVNSSPSIVSNTYSDRILKQKLINNIFSIVLPPDGKPDIWWNKVPNDQALDNFVRLIDEDLQPWRRETLKREKKIQSHLMITKGLNRSYSMNNYDELFRRISKRRNKRSRSSNSLRVKPKRHSFSGPYGKSFSVTTNSSASCITDERSDNEFNSENEQTAKLRANKSEIFEVSSNLRKIAIPENIHGEEDIKNIDFEDTSNQQLKRDATFKNFVDDNNNNHNVNMLQTREEDYEKNQNDRHIEKQLGVHTITSKIFENLSLHFDNVENNGKSQKVATIVFKNLNLGTVRSNESRDSINRLKDRWGINFMKMLAVQEKRFKGIAQKINELRTKNIRKTQACTNIYSNLELNQNLNFQELIRKINRHPSAESLENQKICESYRCDRKKLNKTYEARTCSIQNSTIDEIFKAFQFVTSKCDANKYNFKECVINNDDLEGTPSAFDIGNSDNLQTRLFGSKGVNEMPFRKRQYCGDRFWESDSCVKEKGINKNFRSCVSENEDRKIRHFQKQYDIAEGRRNFSTSCNYQNLDALQAGSKRRSFNQDEKQMLKKCNQLSIKKNDVTKPLSNAAVFPFNYKDLANFKRQNAESLVCSNHRKQTSNIQKNTTNRSYNGFKNNTQSDSRKKCAKYSSSKSNSESRSSSQSSSPRSSRPSSGISSSSSDRGSATSKRKSNIHPSKVKSVNSNYQNYNNNAFQENSSVALGALKESEKNEEKHKNIKPVKNIKNGKHKNLTGEGSKIIKKSLSCTSPVNMQCRSSGDDSSFLIDADNSIHPHVINYTSNEASPIKNIPKKKSLKSATNSLFEHVRSQPTARKTVKHKRHPPSSSSMNSDKLDCDGPYAIRTNKRAYRKSIDIRSCVKKRHLQSSQSSGDEDANHHMITMLTSHGPDRVLKRRTKRKRKVTSYEDSSPFKSLNNLKESTSVITRKNIEFSDENVLKIINYNSVKKRPYDEPYIFSKTFLNQTGTNHFDLSKQRTAGVLDNMRNFPKLRKNKSAKICYNEAIWNRGENVTDSDKSRMKDKNFTISPTHLEIILPEHAKTGRSQKNKRGVPASGIERGAKKKCKKSKVYIYRNSFSASGKTSGKKDSAKKRCVSRRISLKVKAKLRRDRLRMLYDKYVARPV